MGVSPDDDDEETVMYSPFHFLNQMSPVIKIFYFHESSEEPLM